MKTHLVVLSTLIATTTAVTTASFVCLATEVTTFPGCNAFLNSGEACATKTDRPGKQACLCNQAYLDSLFSCENEARQCFRNNALDETFESGLLSWSSLCKTSNSLSFTPTTAPPATFVPYPDEYCNDIRSACSAGIVLLDRCLPFVEDESPEGEKRFSSCVCAPERLRKDYSCDFLGNRSCRATGATMESVLGYSECGNFREVIGTGLPGMIEASRTGPLPTLPAGTATPGSKTNPAAGPSSTNSADVKAVGDALFVMSLVGLSVCFHLLLD
ncbi:hypothetical protein QBC39DRAFT_139892 [Podospora conica]|nr:hypothetical protein QBC39DRAFT_139892 [Schizothecium conicum]